MFAYLPAGAMKCLAGEGLGGRLETSGHGVIPAIQKAKERNNSDDLNDMLIGVVLL